MALLTMASLVSSCIVRSARKEELFGCTAMATHRWLCATQQRSLTVSMIIVNNTTFMRLARCHHLDGIAVVITFCATKAGTTRHIERISRGSFRVQFVCNQKD